MSDRPYETPTPDLIASIQHQAEKLGYMTAQVEKMFAERVRFERHQVTVNHALGSQRLHKLWIAGEITDEESAQRSAELLENTSAHYDAIQAAFTNNINRLNSIVQESVANGKATVNELDNFIDSVLDEDN